MANFVLQELPDEMTDGKKIVYPKMQTYSLHDYETKESPIIDPIQSFRFRTKRYRT